MGKINRLIVATALTTLSATTSFAGSVAGSGGATEVTQIANNAELMQQVASMAESVSIQINQYTTMLQNLQNLDPSALSKMLGPGFDNLGNTLSSVGKLSRAVDGIHNSANNFGYTLENGANMMSRVGQSPTEFITNYGRRMMSQGAYYSTVSETALRQAQDYQKSLDELNATKAELPNIDSQVKGLVTLGTLGAQGNKIALETQTFLLQQMADQAKQKSIDSEEEKYEAEHLQRLREAREAALNKAAMQYKK